MSTIRFVTRFYAVLLLAFQGLVPPKLDTEMKGKNMLYHYGFNQGIWGKD